MGKFYITTAIPYVNAPPHIGHTLEFVQADAIARVHRLLGDDVCLLSGGDENALKNVQAAEKAGKPIQQFIDENASLFQDIAKKLNVGFDVFQKGSDKKKHFTSSQKLWKMCEKSGDIYTKEYEGLYCLGCEAFYTQDELDQNGQCPEHPGKKPELIKETNYFFRLSKYQQKILELLQTNTVRVVPEFRKNEVLSFLSQPLHDISISRTNERAKNWGVPVPGDDSQRMYVWFDALNIYQSGIGFGSDDASYASWWPADVHVIGKGITRFHAVYWIAFLLSAGLSLPKTIFVHGYFTVNGQKMSKTLGNVIDPFYLIEKYKVDPIRYYFLREIPPFSDGDFSEKRFIELYNADLANGLGNLVARVAKLASQADPEIQLLSIPSFKEVYDDEKYIQYKNAISQFRFDETLTFLWEHIRSLDKKLDTHAPWKLSGREKTTVLESIIQPLVSISVLLAPFLPATSKSILELFSHRPIQTIQPLFPRITAQI